LEVVGTESEVIMSSGAAAVVVMLGLLIAFAYGRVHAERGTSPTLRQRVTLGLSVFAVLFPALAMVALSKTTAPISAAEWWECFALSGAIGIAPLATWLVLDIALRLARQWVGDA
jgi:hypothetical protein